MEPEVVAIDRIDSDADDPVANPARGEVGQRLGRPHSRERARTHDGSDKHLRRILIERHLLYTGSARARKLLDDWDNTVAAFVKVTPRDYQRALIELRAERDTAQMAAAE